MLPANLEAVQAERARRSLAAFVRFMWAEIEPGTPLLWNWHIDAVCEHLEAVTRGDIKRLVINIPPGTSKSLLTCVFWPAWEWIDRPETRSLFSAYEEGLAIRDSLRCRQLVTSERYRRHFVDCRSDGDRWTLSGDQNVKGYFQNTRSGFRFSHSVGGRATGYRGNKMVVDDPLNAKDQHSKPARDGVIFWWDKVMSSRLNDQRKGGRVIIMQRLHEEDLTGHVLAKRAGYVHLCLPSEHEPDREPHPGAATSPIGWQDPRAETGQLLFPELFPAEVLQQAKTDLGTSDYAGQHQQRPAPAEGNIFKRHWWRFYDQLPFGVTDWIQSWDMAFKDTKTSSYVVGQVWCRKAADRYLVDQTRDRLDFVATKAAVRSLTSRYPQCGHKLVEDKANGPAIISDLQREIAGLLPVAVEGSKEARAHSTTPEIESGNVWIPNPYRPDGSPHPDRAWVLEWLEELSTFPNAPADDQADATTQALDRYKSMPTYSASDYRTHK